MKLEERKRRIFGKSPWGRYAVACVVFSLLLLLMLVFKKPWDDPAQIWIFAGQFHPLLLHLPIGMLVVVVLMEVISRYHGRKSHATMPLFMATISSIGAVIFGYILMRSNSYPEDAIDAHLWSGVLFTVALLWALFFKMRYNETGRGQPTYWFLLLLSNVLMFAAGHYGGVITHGDPMDEAPWNKKEKSERAVLAPVDERMIYEQVVVPILEQKCYKCHGKKKKKGHLRMDSYEAMLEGGDEGECLVPGDLEKSLMIELVRLPEGDDDRMPPEGKPQLTADELAVIEWWVEIGAPRETKLANLEVPTSVKSALEVISGQSLDPKTEVEKEGTHSDQKSEVDVSKERASHADAVQQLQTKYPGGLTWLSQTDATLAFTAAGMRSDFKDADLKNLQPVARLIVQLNLTGADVSDDSASVLASMTSLRLLRLPETKITDRSIPSIAGLSHLESLNLYGTAITDEGLLKLGSLKQLKKLYLWQTKVTPYGVEALQNVLPDCEINTGGESYSELPKK